MLSQYYVWPFSPSHVTFSFSCCLLTRPDPLHLLSLLELFFSMSLSLCLSLSLSIELWFFLWLEFYLSFLPELHFFLSLSVLLCFSSSQLGHQTQLATGVQPKPCPTVWRAMVQPAQVPHMVRTVPSGVVGWVFSSVVSLVMTGDVVKSWSGTLGTSWADGDEFASWGEDESLVFRAGGYLHIMGTAAILTMNRNRYICVLRCSGRSQWSAIGVP